MLHDKLATLGISYFLPAMSLLKITPEMDNRALGTEDSPDVIPRPLTDGRYRWRSSQRTDSPQQLLTVGLYIAAGLQVSFHQFMMRVSVFLSGTLEHCVKTLPSSFLGKS